MKFGEFIKSKRSEKGFSLREMASKIEVAPSYLSDIEKGRRYAPSRDKILKIAEVLGIVSEADYLFDLAGKSKDSVPLDLAEMIKERETVSTLLRTVKSENVSDRQLKKIIKTLKEKE